jgi:hypothetical protein
MCGVLVEIDFTGNQDAMNERPRSSGLQCKPKLLELNQTI